MLTQIIERRQTSLACLTWRGFRGPQDYRLLANLARRCNLADHVDDIWTVETIANEIEHPVNFIPSEDILIGEIEGRPVAWQIMHWRRDDARYIYLLRGYVSPGWRRRGIGRELLQRGERRLRQVAAGHPTRAERYFSTFASDSRVGKVALFESEGYRPIRHFHTLLRGGLDNLPEAPLPAGVELRPALPEHWRTIWDAKEEAFLDHWMPTAMTEGDYQRWLHSADFDPSLWQVAWDAATNQVAGVSLNLIPRAANAAQLRRRGVVDELCVRRAWRKRGLGRALLVNSLRVFRERGQTEVTLGVDAENLSGALRLYEAVGFRSIEHGIVLRKRLEMTA